MQARTSSCLLAKLTSILGATLALLFASPSKAQVNFSASFDVDSTGWTGNFFRFTGATSCGGSGGAMQRRLDGTGANSTGQLISPLTGTSIGGTCTITFNYKIQAWSANNVAASTPWGTIRVQYGATAAGPWTTFATFANETQLNNTCLSKSFSFNAPAGPLFIRWDCLWTAGNRFWNFDNVSITEVPSSPCITPAPGSTFGSGQVCSGDPFTLSLQNPTPGATVSYQWRSSTVSATGPWTNVGPNAPSYVASQSAPSWYYCDVTCSNGPVTTASNVVFVPQALAPTFPQGWDTPNVVAPDCWSVQALSGFTPPSYMSFSAFGVGTGSVFFSFFAPPAGNQSTLTSPLFGPFATGFVSFDVAGATKSEYVTDQIVLEQSNDGGATWTTVVTMNNQLGGQLNTGGFAFSSGFFPSATQWASLQFPLAAGTNRIRFRSIAGFGNNVFLDNVNITPNRSAAHATLGTGCYNVRSSLCQEFFSSPAAKAALDGNSMTFTPSGTGYTAVWNGGATYVAPTGGATTLAFLPNNDDGVVTITPSLATPIPGGSTTTWTVSSNGILTAGPVGNNGTSSSPGRSSVGLASGLAFYTWCNWNANEAGSGPIQSEEVGNMLYITWNSVEAYGTPSPNVGTWQFQIDMSTGVVSIVWVSFETSTGANTVIVGATLAGVGPQPPITNLSTATPFELGASEQFAMSLSAVGKPINGGPAPTYTVSNIPEYFPGTGIYGCAIVFGFTSYLPAGLDLGSPPLNIGAPGCFAYQSQDVTIILGNVGAPSITFPIAWSVPSVPAGPAWMQAVGQFFPGSLPNGKNPGGYLTSNTLEIYISSY